MKKKFVSLLFLTVFSLQLFAQTVPQEQRTLITKITAAWCHNCGTWGWEMFEGLIEDNENNEEKAVVFANHYSGDLAVPASQEIAANFNITSQPRFFVNDEDQDVNSAILNGERLAIKAMVDANFLTDPIANTGIDVSTDGNELQINTLTKFFQATSGAYYLGVYVLTDNIFAYQAGQSAVVSHKKVLRATATSETFGELLMDGEIEMNMEFDHDYTITIDNEWNVEDLEIITIIWKKENGTYHFVNANNINEIGTGPTSIEDDFLYGASLDIFPNIISSNATISINSDHSISDATLRVFDLSGKVVLDFYEGPLAQGNTTFMLNHSAIPKGTYFLTLQSNDKLISKKIITQ